MLVENDARTPARFRLAPVVAQNRPERLIVILAVALERAAQDALLHGPQLSKRPVCASIRHGGARLEPVHTEHVEGEVDDHPRAFRKHAGPPVWRRERKSPFGVVETGTERTDAKQSDRRLAAPRHDGEARIFARGALTIAPCDEALEPLD